MSIFEKRKTHVTGYYYESAAKLLAKVQEYKYAVIYKIDGVQLYDARYLTEEAIRNFNELRAFNDKGELRVTSFNGEYRGRIRTDIDVGSEGGESGECSEGYHTEAIDEIHRLWGDPLKNEPSSKKGYTVLSEDRGVKLEVPFDVPNGQYAFVEVRNYLSPDQDVFEFDDWRMVRLFAMEAEEYDKEE